jgi:hypothetical protein
LETVFFAAVLCSTAAAEEPLALKPTSKTWRAADTAEKRGK